MTNLTHGSEILPSDEQRTPSLNQDRRSLYPNPLLVGQTDHQHILKLQADSLFLKVTQLEDKLKHYNKLKKKWNRLKNILRYSKYPIAILFAVADVELTFIPIVGIPLAIISTTVTLDEVIIANILVDSFVNVKVNNYNKKCKHISTWIYRMYLFKQDTLSDGVIDLTEFTQWKEILNKYKESLNKITSPTNEERINLKKIKEQINLLINKNKQYI